MTIPTQTHGSDQAAPPHRATLIRAMLRGGALGDAMGAEIEFWSLPRIRARFPDRIDRLLPHQGLTGAITDDTQMTLFTAEGLIHARLHGAVDASAIVHHALLRWFVTQGRQARMALCDVGLVADRRLHACRAPGLTCLSALAAATKFGQPARNDSKGCGTIMRVAPVAFWPGPDARRLAAETSALTHGHPTGAEAAACFTDILRAVADGVPVAEAARGALALTRDETATALRAALDAPRDGLPETVETLGGGWVAEEALAIAVYAGLCARDLDHGLQIALIHSGDSDSTGAIAGNLLGLMFPEQVMQHPLQAQVECGDLIDRLARDLAWLDGIDGATAQALAGDYPGR